MNKRFLSILLMALFACFSCEFVAAYKGDSHKGGAEMTKAPDYSWAHKRKHGGQGRSRIHCKHSEHHPDGVKLVAPKKIRHGHCRCGASCDSCKNSGRTCECASCPRGGHERGHGKRHRVVRKQLHHVKRKAFKRGYKQGVRAAQQDQVPSAVSSPDMTPLA